MTMIGRSRPDQPPPGRKVYNGSASAMTRGLKNVSIVDSDVSQRSYRVGRSWGALVRVENEEEFLRYYVMSVGYR